MKRNNPAKAKQKSKAVAESAGADPQSAEPDSALRALARRHCEAAIAALAGVVSDAEAPAGARITAATTLLGWAFGREGADGAAKGQGARKSPSTEQVIRLAWLETKARKRGRTQKRGKARRSKKETSRTEA